jgi:hypothetical protein
VALCSNGATFFGTGIKRFGAAAYQSAYPSVLQGNICQAGTLRNITAGEGITSPLVSLPSGNLLPSAWMMPQRGGALASRNAISGAGACVISMAGGVNGEATLAGAGAVSGTAALIVSLVAALTGSGTISNAQALAYLNLAATLAGAGNLVGAMGAIAHASAALAGDGDAGGTSTALGALAASLIVTGDLLNTANVGAAVWSAIASVNNIAGTMGQALNSAGSAGDPWITNLPGAYTGTQAGALLDAINTLVAELHRIHGLESGTPLVVTETSREAGGIAQSITEAPAGTVTVTRT